MPKSPVALVGFLVLAVFGGIAVAFAAWRWWTWGSVGGPCHYEPFTASCTLERVEAKPDLHSGRTVIHAHYTAWGGLPGQRVEVTVATKPSDAQSLVDALNAQPSVACDGHKITRGTCVPYSMTLHMAPASTDCWIDTGSSTAMVEGLCSAPPGNGGGG